MSATTEFSPPTDPVPAVSPGRLSPPSATSDPVFIRTATTGDLADTARLQIDELPLGLFPSLGHRFVARWHATFLDSPHAVALAAVRRSADGRESVVGFLVGSTDRDAFRREMLLRHRRSLLLHGMAGIAVRPRVLLRFLRTRLRPYLRRLLADGGPSADAVGHAEPTDEPIGDLTAIAVDGRLRRSGSGRRMVDIYLARCAAIGIGWVELTTVLSAEEARAFYTATGWSGLSRNRTRDGVVVQRYGREPGLPEGAP